MHVEKNVSTSLLGFVVGVKDTVAVRRNMEERGAPATTTEPRNCRLQHMPHLHLQLFDVVGHYFKPHALYTITAADKGRFVNLNASVRTPTGYAGPFGKHLEKKKLGGLKSHHEYHALIQQIVLASICLFL